MAPMDELRLEETVSRTDISGVHPPECRLKSTHQISPPPASPPMNIQYYTMSHSVQRDLSVDYCQRAFYCRERGKENIKLCLTRESRETGTYTTDAAPDLQKSKKMISGEMFNTSVVGKGGIGTCNGGVSEGRQ